MSLRNLLGLDDVDISDADIMAEIKHAFEKDLHEVEFLKGDGSKVVIELPRIDFSKHIDPWDGWTSFGQGAA